MHRRKTGRLVSITGIGLVLLAGMAGASERPKIPWDLHRLSMPLRVHDAFPPSTSDIRAVFFDGLPWKGKPTRVFAYIGVPSHQPAEKVPGIVLVHGGLGTAFPDGVRLWMSRGYAAISMDTCGCVSVGGLPQRDDMGGPPGWGGFDQIEWATEDQWTYHTVADVILANSLLRTQPSVDPDRIGVTGISWGGFLTCIVAGLDDRLCFAVPVYGCGYIGDESAWTLNFKELGDTERLSGYACGILRAIWQEQECHSFG
jgi:dienelactone hydrolase